MPESEAEKATSTVAEGVVKEPIADIDGQSVNNGGVEVAIDDYQKIIKDLLSGGNCKRINGLVIKNVNFTELDNYTRVCFTLKSNVNGYIPDGEGGYSKGKTNTIYISLWGIVGAIKQDEDLAWMANHISEHPTCINLLLNGATIDIIQQEFVAGEQVVNPFSRNKDGNITDHDLYTNNIIRFKLGNTGNRMADKLANKMLDM